MDATAFNRCEPATAGSARRVFTGRKAGQCGRAKWQSYCRKCKSRVRLPPLILLQYSMIHRLEPSMELVRRFSIAHKEGKPERPAGNDRPE
ncbi:hypothetical protein GGE43_002111 [Agrobacterium tumefaciens]|uniref:Uncharacterized protein n=1 Tax=Agrobacterium radiobacter TaxID=362 RepID=A0ABR6J633_AGRRD|nr:MULTISPECIES: hypothetical protein [Agrobacterium tumefaciens complex]MBB4318408.1 hypothetical protein [Agrobacterium radiobacter]MBB4333572.1 hypothetical protein [Agrobacterium radiobacter]MBB4490335.1 hypothetical protein [Agrobacterium radiobacter]MBB4495613.1 hypothetical protein [Agrobacterium radiobacter]MBB4500890.1 hypothetical protein [Agrobacterium radiobacter]